MATKPTPVSNAPFDYLERDLPMKRIAGWVVGMYFGLAGVLGLVYYLYGAPHTYPDADLVLNRPMNQPTLQSHAAKDMAEFLKMQNEQLSFYGWVNKPQGVVRLPIDRAMDLVISRGIPARGAKE